MGAPRPKQTDYAQGNETGSAEDLMTKISQDPGAFERFWEGVKSAFTPDAAVNPDYVEALKQNKKAIKQPPPGQDERPDLVNGSGNIVDEIVPEEPGPDMPELGAPRMVKASTRKITPTPYTLAPQGFPKTQPKSVAPVTPKVEHSLNESPDKPTPPPTTEGAAQTPTPPADDGGEKDPLLRKLEARLRGAAETFRPAVDWGPLGAFVDSWTGSNLLKGYKSPGTPLDQLEQISDQVRKWEDSRSNKKNRESQIAVRESDAASKLGMIQLMNSLGMIPRNLQSIGQVEASVDATKAKTGLTGAQTGRTEADTQRLVAETGRLQALTADIQKLSPAKRDALMARARAQDAAARRSDADAGKIASENDILENDLKQAQKDDRAVRPPAGAKGGSKATGTGAAAAKLKSWDSKRIDSFTDNFFLQAEGKPRFDPSYRNKANWRTYNQYMNSQAAKAASDPSVKTPEDFDDYMNESAEAYRKALGK